MDRKPTQPLRPAGIQSMSQKLYRELRKTIRALAPPAPATATAQA